MPCMAISVKGQIAQFRGNYLSSPQRAFEGVGVMRNASIPEGGAQALKCPSVASQGASRAREGRESR